MRRVVAEGVSRWRSLIWGELPQELAIAEGYPAGTIDTNDILIELTNLNDCASLVPLFRVRTSLVLNPYMIAYDQRGEALGVLRPAFGRSHVPVAQCLFPGHQCLPPGGMWTVSSGTNGDEISDWPAKDTHSWRDLGVGVRGVAVLENGPLDRISV